MLYTIENDALRCEIDTQGAQLHALTSKQTGKDYLWRGDPAIWYGQAPILFPIIGQLIDNSYCFEGRRYTMPKHGLARKLPFTLDSIGASQAVFRLDSSEETRASYPFDWSLYAAFSLDGAALTNRLTVVNRTNGPMLFSVGAHPAFNCAIGDRLVFEQAETVSAEKIDKENLLRPERFPVLENARELVLTKDLFNDDALILSGLRSRSVELTGEHALKFTFGDCPFLGIWAKPGAPYVCIEPWYGINDDHTPRADFSEKRGIQRLEQGETFSFAWTAEIL
ncbi:MAG: aldose 1-epimerase family protein [Clostridia bacterium]|nr:aldose 1-epimerase family protein [Clostridia bacterium]